MKALQTPADLHEARDGVTRLQFDRRAANLDEALAGAIESVERGGVAAARVEIERHEVPQIA